MPSKFLFVVMSLMTLAALPAGANDNTPPTRKISVEGRSEVSVVPDQIIVSLAVISREAELDEAKADNDARVKNILALTKTFQLEPWQVQTSRMELNPEYRNRDSYMSPGELIGYIAEKTITFTLTRPEQLESFISDAIEAGANKINSVRFDSTEERKHMDKARVMALQAAREKAVLLASTLDMVVGSPLAITEETRYWQPPSMYTNSVCISREGESMSAESFALGQIPIIAEVSVEFEMTPKANEPQTTKTHAESDAQGSSAAASASAAVTRGAQDGPGEMISPYGGKPSAVQ